MRTEMLSAALVLAVAACPAAEPPPFAFVVIDAGGVPPGWLTGDPEVCPTFHALARAGVTVLSHRCGGGEHVKAVEAFLGAGGGAPPWKGHAPERTYVLAPVAGPYAEIARGARFFAPDPRVPALGSLLERYGVPAVLDEEDIGAVGKVRARYGAEVSTGEGEFALLLGGRTAPRSADAVVLRRLLQLVRNQEASFVLAVLSDADAAHRDVDEARLAVRRNDRALGEVWTLLNEEPYRTRSVLAYISVLGRESAHAPSGHAKETASCAVIVAPSLRAGMVLGEPQPTGTVRALLFHALGSEEGGALPEGVVRE